MIPVYFMRTEGVRDDEYNTVWRAAKDILRISGASRIVKNFGVWREKDWKEDGKLKPWRSIDWYVEECMMHGKDEGHGDQVNASKLLDMLYREPWKRKEDHYDFFVVDKDLARGPEDAWVVGGRITNSTVISVSRWRRIKPYSFRMEVLKTQAYHEGGHVFGAATRARDDTIELLGSHCTEYGCSMKQGMSIREWKKNTEERIDAGQPYCGKCTDEIKEYGRKIRGRKVI
ncbi:MAG: hypothetical protein ACE5J7_00045 [Candidatus Aenigmatarchaeota archaeon]